MNGQGYSTVKSQLKKRCGSGVRVISQKNVDGQSEGSLILFISFLFLIALIVSMGVVDISDSFLAKRSLISVGENLLSEGVGQIDQTRYYENGIDPATGRVPIDCDHAYEIMASSVTHIFLRGAPVTLQSVECVNDILSLSLSIEIHPLVTIPFVSNFSSPHELITAHLLEAAIEKSG